MKQIEDEIGRSPLVNRRDEILELAEPTVGLATARVDMGDVRIGQSRMGGVPDLPDGVPWPLWQGEAQSFVAQLNLTELSGLPGCEALPGSGWLAFFYSARQDTWGFDPKDRDSWRVIHLPVEAELSRRRAPDDLQAGAVFHPCSLEFVPTVTIPPWESLQVRRLDLDDAATDAYCDLTELAQAPVDHLLLGWPDQIQGDIAGECQLVSHGLNLGDGSVWRDLRAQELLERSDEWRLLLQVGSDDNAGMMWGDAGSLYFSIRRADLASREFGHTWMTLQCH